MMNSQANGTSNSGAVAVYCGSSTGNHLAFTKAATSLGRALARDRRPLVYGGGSKGIMGIVSGACLQEGGDVTGIVPFAMVAAGGEQEKSKSNIHVHLKEEGRERVKTIVVDSMHERKVEMARLAEAFVGLPGGFGTFEEVLEVATWTQIGIHKKPVVLVNVLGFWNPLRDLIKSSIAAGFIKEESEKIIVFVDGPEDAQHEDFDWGQAVLQTIDAWSLDQMNTLFDWSKRMDGTNVDALSST